MTLLLALGPERFIQVSRSYSVRVVQEFVKYATIPEVKSKLDLRSNMFGVMNGLGALQDEQLKNNHLLGVPLQILYAIDLH